MKTSKTVRPAPLEIEAAPAKQVLLTDVALRDGQFTRVDEARLLAEIHREIEGLAAQFAASEASVAPVRAAMDALYRRTLQSEIPADTHPARLR